MMRRIVVGAAWVGASSAAVRINEVADRGGGGACGGRDWVELANDGAADVALAGYVLHDAKGPTADDVYSFGADEVLPAHGFLVVCCSGTADRDVFGVNPFDSVHLLDASGSAVAAAGPMTGDGGSPGITYAWDGAAYAYTATATPGDPNEFSAVVPRKARLKAQNVCNPIIGPHLSRAAPGAALATVAAGAAAALAAL